uniref:PRE_C2HC domain-containing protein n=1 Tax=Rhabditophanes sp. KR3021 TaxID=114890 RepID=A0AC35TY86_9BILA
MISTKFSDWIKKDGVRDGNKHVLEDNITNKLADTLQITKSIPVKKQLPGQEKQAVAVVSDEVIPSISDTPTTSKQEVPANENKVQRFKIESLEFYAFEDNEYKFCVGTNKDLFFDSIKADDKTSLKGAIPTIFTNCDFDDDHFRLEFHDTLQESILENLIALIVNQTTKVHLHIRFPIELLPDYFIRLIALKKRFVIITFDYLEAETVAGLKLVFPKHENIMFVSFCRTIEIKKCCQYKPKSLCSSCKKSIKFSYQDPSKFKL